MDLLLTRIDRAQVEIGCGNRQNFVSIARQLGVPISEASYSLAINGKRRLDANIVSKLWDVAVRMRELSEAIGLPLDWSKSEAISMALLNRLVAQVAAELHDPNADKFQEFARSAERDVML